MKKLVGTGLLTLMICLGAYADDSAEKFERTIQEIQRDNQVRFDAELPPANRALIDYGGYLTLAYLSFDDANHDNHGLRRYELVGYGRINLDGVHEIYARGRADYDDYNRGDSFGGEPSTLAGRMEEGWYRFDLQRYASEVRDQKIDYDVSVKAGRQFVSWGSGLTLEQYADGVSAEFRNKRLVVDALACVTVKETIDFDNTRPDFDHNTHRGYFGSNVALPIGHHTPYAFFLVQRDFNRPEVLDPHLLPTRFVYDSYYAGIGSKGALGDNLAYTAEFCYEGGHGLSSSYNPATFLASNQTDDRIDACAANLRIDYLLNDTRKTRLSAQFIIASGDPDRGNTTGTFGGNQAHTPDNAFNSLGVIYDGFAFTPPVSDIMIGRVGASTYPVPTGVLRGLQTGADFFIFGKTRQDGAIDESTSNTRFLGVEPDGFINWQITVDVSLAVRYGVFFPGAAIPAGNQNHIRQFLYAAVTYAF